MKQFNNYQLYTVLHPEDCAPSFAGVTQTAIRVLKPEGKCTKETKDNMEDGIIPDMSMPTDAVAQVYLADLIEQGLAAGLPCLKGLMELTGATGGVKILRTARACAKSTTLCNQARSWDDIKRLVADPETSKGFHNTVEDKGEFLTPKQADEILCKDFREKILPPISVSSADPTSTEALINISRMVDSTKVAKRLFYELAALYQKHKPDLRRGQCVFNLMHHVHPVQACKYSGSDIDPFHDNSKIRVFVDTCYKEAKKKRGKK